jgi:hypothetical protein
LPRKSDSRTAVACTVADMNSDPTQTDPDKYAVIFETERVRVLKYKTSPATEHHRIDTPTAPGTPSASSSDARPR